VKTEVRERVSEGCHSLRLKMEGLRGDWPEKGLGAPLAALSGTGDFIGGQRAGQTWGCQYSFTKGSGKRRVPESRRCELKRKRGEGHCIAVDKNAGARLTRKSTRKSAGGLTERRRETSPDPSPGPSNPVAGRNN